MNSVQATIVELDQENSAHNCSLEKYDSAHRFSGQLFVQMAWAKKGQNAATALAATTRKSA